MELTPNPKRKTLRPQLTVEQIGGGYRLREVPGCGRAGFVVGVIVAAGLLYFGIGIFEGFPDADGWVAYLFGVAMIAAAGGILYAVFRSWRIRSALHPGELLLDTWPIPRGGRANVRYFRRMKSSLAVREAQAVFYCEEAATYTVGTDTTTVREKDHEFAFEPVRVEPLADTVQADYVLEVPLDPPPSLNVYRNVVSWQLKITLVIDRFPDTTSQFEILVAP
jgi:hypothetical protein